MTTKDDPLLSSKRTCNNQFKDLNLTQNHKYHNFEPVESKHVNTKISRNETFVNQRVNGNSRSWTYLKNKERKCGFEEPKEEDAKKWKNHIREDSKIKNASTLSLHIAAYENTIESCEKSKLEASSNNLAPLPKFQDSLEFPRQMDNDEPTAPEIMQFTTSQKLLDIPKNQMQRREVSTEEKEGSQKEEEYPVDQLAKLFHVGENFLHYTISGINNDGGCGLVLFASDVHQNNVAIKLESMNATNLLEKEIQYYKLLAKSRHFNQVICHGKDEDKQIAYMVFPLLGESIHDWKEKLADSVNYYTIGRIFQQSLMALEDMHDAGLIHRDIKLQNLLFGRKETDKRQRIYLIDLGLSTEFNDVQEDVTLFIGTNDFASLTAHEKLSQSYCDDLFSLWISIYSLIKEYPWKEIRSTKEIYESKQRFMKGDQRKIDTKDLTPGMVSMYDYIVSLKFGEKPNYLRLHHYVNLIMECHNFPPEILGLQRYISQVQWDSENCYLEKDYGIKHALKYHHLKNSKNFCILFERKPEAPRLYKEGKSTEMIQSYRTKAEKFNTPPGIHGYKIIVKVMKSDEPAEGAAPNIVYFDYEEKEWSTAITESRAENSSPPDNAEVNQREANQLPPTESNKFSKAEVFQKIDKFKENISFAAPVLFGLLLGGNISKSMLDEPEFKEYKDYLIMNNSICNLY